MLILAAAAEVDWGRMGGLPAPLTGQVTAGSATTKTTDWWEKVGTQPSKRRMDMVEVWDALNGV